MNRFYTELARWWPLVSPVEQYAGEAAEIERVLREAAPEGKTVLELGSGGGHNAFHLKRSFQLTLTDLSEDMLEVSRALNPECEHLCGDMRTLALGRTFDLVFVHDAVDYMTTETDLGAAMATAYRHCQPGGAALFVPDHLEESFGPGTDWGGSDGARGEGIRFLEWSYDPDPTDTSVTTVYTFVTREADGRIGSFSEGHHFGLFSRAQWLRLLSQQGFFAEALIERTNEDRLPRVMFLGRRPQAASST
jgi:ubiquinone/menaquinone biosynthesis C-methylase UbiE